MKDDVEPGKPGAQELDPNVLVRNDRGPKLSNPFAA